MVAKKLKKLVHFKSDCLNVTYQPKLPYFNQFTKKKSQIKDIY